MSLYKQISQIDKRTKSTVNGLVREMEKELKLNHIPNMINSMCILFFRDDEIFDIIGRDVKVSENKKIITKLQGHWQNNTYGIMEIPSMSNIIYTWTLKIHHLELNSGHIMIGISSVQSPSTYFEIESNGIHYVYHGEGKIYYVGYSPKWVNDDWCSYGDGCVENDIFSVELDLKSKQIKFFINGEDQGVAYTNIDKDDNVKYRLMVSMAGKDDCVEILNFSKK